MSQLEGSIRVGNGICILSCALTHLCVCVCVRGGYELGWCEMSHPMGSRGFWCGIFFFFFHFKPSNIHWASNHVWVGGAGEWRLMGNPAGLHGRSPESFPPGNIKVFWLHDHWPPHAADCTTCAVESLPPSQGVRWLSVNKATSQKKVN